MAKTQRVVVVGGGFGGLHATQCLRNVPVAVTLIDRRNFHLFQPLLYQVATGWLSPANIAANLRAILKRHKNTHVLLAEVTGLVEFENKVLVFIQWAWYYFSRNRAARLITGNNRGHRK